VGVLSTPPFSPNPEYSGYTGLSIPPLSPDPVYSGYTGLSGPSPSPDPGYTGLATSPSSRDLMYPELATSPPSPCPVYPGNGLGSGILIPNPAYSGLSNEELVLQVRSKVLTTKLCTDIQEFDFQVWEIGDFQVQVSMQKEINLRTGEIILRLWLLGTGTLTIEPYGIYQVQQLDGKNQWVRIDGLEDSENIDATLVQTIPF